MSMYLQEILIFIYCLPFWVVVMGGLVVSFLFMKLCRRYGDQRWFGIGTCLMLLLWFAVVVWATLLSRSTPVTEPPVWIPLHSYREAFFEGEKELIRSNLMNIALFYPGGLLAARLFPQASLRWRRLVLVLVFSGVLSLGIELCQLYFLLGKPEIDDVLHNTLGAAAGFAAFHLNLGEQP